jgi:hypothetical protein
MARTVYVSTATDGGGSGIDGIDGAAIAKGDVAILIDRNSTSLPGTMGSHFGIYMATTKAAALDSPEVLVPDVNAGSWNWEKQSYLFSVYQTTGKAATLPNYGVTVIRTTATSVHLLRRPRRGSWKKLIFATTSPIKVRLSTSVNAYTVRIARVGLITGTSMCVIVGPTSRATMRIPASLELVGRTTARWELCGVDYPSTGTIKGKCSFSSTT